MAAVAKHPAATMTSSCRLIGVINTFSTFAAMQRTPAEA